ncbi:ABC transporter permease [Nesterenkonia sp. Act20]|uniref:ABC transporter permease n=1 Tax=Nesterenkonia sp. Act20 TaxID=1483432 RepID=UPI001C4834ED|nr:ABC transporter permease [Nesterenkonia sp. Act20]
MNNIVEAVRWLLTADAWSGTGGLWVRSMEHLGYTLIALGISAAIALPLGLLIGHTGKGRGAAVVATGAARALPTLGLLTLVALFTGIGLTAPMVALVILAAPSVLAGAYAGVESVNPATVDAARAQGMSGWQVLTRVEIPLGLPLILSGLRLAALQIIATATLAAYVGAGGLGRPLFLGLRTYDYPLMLGTSIVVILLAILVDAVFGTGQRLLRRIPGLAGPQRAPRGQRRDSRRATAAAPAAGR